MPIDKICDDKIAQCKAVFYCEVNLFNICDGNFKEARIRLSNVTKEK